MGAALISVFLVVAGISGRTEGVKSKELGAGLESHRTELSEFYRKIADSVVKAPSRR